MAFALKMRRFFHSENGAVTVDWVFLTAILVGLTILALTTIETASMDTLDGVATQMSSI